MLLTLWLTAKIADSAKQREVRQAMQLVALELRDNLQVIQDYKWMYNDEKRVAYRLKEHDFSLDGLPADTVAYYTRRITGSMGKPYRFLTDALEMFKTTGIASDIADKQIVIDLLRCYNELGAFDNSMNIYYDQRMKAILPEQMGGNLVVCGYEYRQGIRQNARQQKGAELARYDSEGFRLTLLRDE